MIARAIRRAVRTWRLGKALQWAHCNNATIRPGARSDGYSIVYGVEVVAHGVAYFSGDIARALELAQSERQNPGYRDSTRVPLPEPIGRPQQ